MSDRAGGDRAGGDRVELSTRVGSLVLASPVMTAAGTSGHGAELAAYLDLERLGAVVVKSLSARAWPGNPAPRVAPLAVGMIHSVGLQGPGVGAWLEEELPLLEASRAAVVVSLWGRTIEEYGEAAGLLAGTSRSIVAVEVNVSCPNLEDGRRMFAHSATATAEAVSAAGAAGLPRWAKLSPGGADVVEIAGAAISAGAEAVTLVNTLPGMAIDVETRRPVLGAGGGGVSGAALHPIAVRAVHDCRAAFPGASIVGAGGVATGRDAVELLLAGANAVQVGTATFEDPRAPGRVLAELQAWCIAHGLDRVTDLVSGAHRADQ